LRGVSVRTRFAPSPTGDLHLGGALTALASHWLARSAPKGGQTLLRVEDLDRPRVVAGAEARQEEDLAWLGLDWDLGPYRQSERLDEYERALRQLGALGRTYPCDCSRAEIARVASAPHEGEEVVYPGTCRDLPPERELRRAPAWRLRVETSDVVAWTDGVRGPVEPGLVRAGGDFVLRRGDGVFAYQLAVAVDDLVMGITAVVRGDDLVASTPRQLLLMKLLAGSERLPEYWHLPLVRAADGTRLAKRTPGSTVRDLRARGHSAERVVGQLAHALGLVPSSQPMSVDDLVRSVPAGTPFAKTAWRIPA
jgi:glutamyl-tRNA synthetase